MIFKYHGTECDHQGNMEKRAEPVTLLATDPGTFQYEEAWREDQQRRLGKSNLQTRWGS